MRRTGGRWRDAGASPGSRPGSPPACITTHHLTPIPTNTQGEEAGFSGKGKGSGKTPERSGIKNGREDELEEQKVGKRKRTI